MKKVEVRKLDIRAILPTRNNSTDAGIDLYALEDTFVPFEETIKVRTGIAVNVPSGYVGKIFSRSSLASKGLSVDAGVIDAGYNGECCVVLHNLTHHHDHNMVFKSGYHIRRGDKIAQLVIFPIETPEVIEVTENWTSERGDRGFGSSGV